MQGSSKAIALYMTILSNSEMLPCPVERDPGHQRVTKSQQTLPASTPTVWQSWGARALRDEGPEDTQESKS